jgi:hypothetical protein
LVLEEVTLFYIEIERADGEVYFWSDKKLFENVEEAESRAEFFWNLKAHTGEFASFRVVEDATGEVYSELEC